MAPKRGGVYWGNPTYPDGSGGKAKDHRCLVLRTPQRFESVVPILTLHSVIQPPRIINDCCHRLDQKQYRLKLPTYIDARMTMFAHLHSLGGHAFDLDDDDMDEIEFCLMNALELPFPE